MNPHIKEVRKLVNQFDTTNTLIKTIRGYCLEQLDLAEISESSEQVYEHLAQVNRLIELALDQEPRRPAQDGRRQTGPLPRYVPTDRRFDLVTFELLLASLTSQDIIVDHEGENQMSTKLLAMNALKNVVVKDAYAVIVIDGETGDLTIFSDITPAKSELIMVLDNGMEDYE